MFTGIIEETGIVKAIRSEGENIIFTISCSFVNDIILDQSISHNGCCLSISHINLQDGQYEVTAIHETLRVTNLGQLLVDHIVNLERSLRVGDRLDGHFVQGHVDQKAKLSKIEDQNGSFLMTFSFEEASKHVMVNKGSVCLNGISLTVVAPTKSSFQVAIIPLTWDMTNLSDLQINDFVNIEFDIFGKYIEALQSE